MSNEYYQTSDFCLATTLTSLGFQTIGLDRSNPKRVNFSFSDSKQLQIAISQYWEKQIKVSPLDFYYAQKKLKSLLYRG